MRRQLTRNLSVAEPEIAGAEAEVAVVGASTPPAAGALGTLAAAVAVPILVADVGIPPVKQYQHQNRVEKLLN